MSAASNYCKTKYYSQFDSNMLAEQIRDSLGLSVSNFSEEMIYILWEILNMNPNYYFSKTAFEESYSNLELLYGQSKDKIMMNENMFEYFIMGYDAYKNISQIMTDLDDFNIASSIKTRLYRIPIYTSIMESALGNLLRIIAIMEGNSKGKDYSKQNTISKLKDVLYANGYTVISNCLNENIRNSINHGRVFTTSDVSGDCLQFYYVENHIDKCVKYQTNQFDKMIYELYDVTSAILLALALFINNHSDILQTPQSSNLLFRFLSLKFSVPGVYCLNINDVADNDQINMEVDIHNTDRGYIGQISVMLGCMMYEFLPNYNRYLISFSSARMFPGFIRFNKHQIHDIFYGIRSFDDVISEVIKKSEFMIYNASEEALEENDYKYFVFPNISKGNYTINHIHDASLEDRKRLRAHLFIGDTDDRQEILRIISDAIEELKQLRNPPDPKMIIKHGNMEADALYINVYRNDTRANKEISPKNANFVCFVDYNISGVTTLLNGGLLPGIWNSLYKEKQDLIDIAWRERKHLGICGRKIGRNELCPCGSGKKYKKCCGKSKQ